MKNPRVKKPIATLAERQKAISRRPLSEEQINKLNRIFERIDQEQQVEEEKPLKKIARSPEAKI